LYSNSWSKCYTHITNSRWWIYFGLYIIVRFIIIITWKILCFVINALHWGFLTFQKYSSKMVFIVYFLVVLLFIIIPIALLVLIGVNTINNPSCNENCDIRKDIHMIHIIEAIYHSSLDILVIIIFLVSWCILSSRLKEFSGLIKITELRKKITRQMILYITFFFLRAVLLFSTSVNYLIPGCRSDFRNIFSKICYFLEPVCGTCPLVYFFFFVKIICNIIMIIVIIIITIIFFCRRWWCYFIFSIDLIRYPLPVSHYPLIQHMIQNVYFILFFFFMCVFFCY
jgi:hypothetical protein